MSESQTTVLDLLRHGEPEVRNSLLGRFDVPLSESGWQQLQKVAEELKHYDQVISSPLVRCRAFAESLTAEKKWPLQISSDWQEMNFGDWDGKSYEWLHDNYPKALSDFWSDPWQHTPPGGETFAEFYDRIQLAWKKLLVEHSGKKILLVCHSGSIRMLLSAILEMNPEKALVMSRLNIPYASLTRIEIYQDAEGEYWPRIMFMNGREADF